MRWSLFGIENVAETLKNQEKAKKDVDSFIALIYNKHVRKRIIFMHEWLSGGASPCQGEGRGFESRLVLFLLPEKPCIYNVFRAILFL